MQYGAAFIPPGSSQLAMDWPWLKNTVNSSKMPDIGFVGPTPTRSPLNLSSISGHLFRFQNPNLLCSRQISPRVQYVHCIPCEVHSVAGIVHQFRKAKAMGPIVFASLTAKGCQARTRPQDLRIDPCSQRNVIFRMGKNARKLPTATHPNGHNPCTAHVRRRYKFLRRHGPRNRSLVGLELEVGQRRRE
jgi:hypothetical protein